MAENVISHYGFKLTRSYSEPLLEVWVHELKDSEITIFASGRVRLTQTFTNLDDLIQTIKGNKNV